MATWSEHEFTQRWIPLTVEQPPEGRVVWVWAGVEQMKAYRSGDAWLRELTGERITEVITHFMWVRE